MGLPRRSTVYSGNAITLSVGLMAIDGGKGADTFLEIEEEEDDWEYTVGIDGEGVFSLMPAGPTRIKVTLLQTSAGNAILSALHIASKEAEGLTYPVYYEDRKGTSKGASASAVITKLPPEKFGKSSDSVTWELLCHGMARFVGGH
jgi:hypothetical protein